MDGFCKGSVRLVELLLSILNLSTGAYNALRRSGIHTIIQLVSLSAEELLRIKAVGKKRYREIANALDNAGIKHKF